MVRASSVVAGTPDAESNRGDGILSSRYGIHNVDEAHAVIRILERRLHNAKMEKIRLDTIERQAIALDKKATDNVAQLNKMMDIVEEEMNGRLGLDQKDNDWADLTKALKQQTRNQKKGWAMSSSVSSFCTSSEDGRKPSETPRSPSSPITDNARSPIGKPFSDTSCASASDSDSSVAAPLHKPVKLLGVSEVSCSYEVAIKKLGAAQSCLVSLGKMLQICDSAEGVQPAHIKETVDLLDKLIRSIKYTRDYYDRTKESRAERANY